MVTDSVFSRVVPSATNVSCLVCGDADTKSANWPVMNRAPDHHAMSRVLTSCAADIAALESVENRVHRGVASATKGSEFEHG